MPATFTSYLDAQARCDPAHSDAYIRVRVSHGPRPDGSILVYLPNGTGLVVNSNQLLRLGAGPNCPGWSTAGLRPRVRAGTAGDTPVARQLR